MIKAVIFDMYETLITHYECPLYFGAQMALDAGIEEEKFQKIWHATEYERTVGKVSFEAVIELILKENQCYSKVLFETIVNKRKFTKQECFKHLNKEIIPMLNSLKEQGIKIGLISNCFSEEVEAIRESILFPYFDAVCLSYEQGIQKPDEKIFISCMDELSVKADECVYVGDGGSYELETATKLGMKAVQAVWYLKDGTLHTSKRNEKFIQAEMPMELLDFI